MPQGVPNLGTEVLAGSLAIVGSILLAVGLVAYNSLANRWKAFRSWAYVPANLVLCATVVAIGVWGFGLDRDEMGLRWEAGWMGAVIGVVVMIPVFALLAFEQGRTLLRDTRLAGVRGARAAYMIAIRIPVGTALVEEVAFRGVLLGGLLHRAPVLAVALSSVAFGLWHIVPTLIVARTNRLPVGAVPGGVVLTTAAGVLLCLLRIETGSVAAPVFLHATVNSLGAAAAMLALSRRPPREANESPLA